MRPNMKVWWNDTDWKTPLFYSVFQLPLGTKGLVSERG